MTVGVFDSGVGGLAFFRELDRRRPLVPRIYLGDHANLPYGEKSSEEIIQLTCSGVIQLVDLGCTRIVVACNTASILAVPSLKAELCKLDKKIDLFDISSPTIRYFENSMNLDTSKSTRGLGEKCRVGIFATPATVRSEYFSKEINRLGSAEVQQVACHQLVDAIENSDSMEYIRSRIYFYVDQLNQKFSGLQPHIVVLGCTHYSVVRDIFHEILGKDCQIINQEQLLMEDFVGIANYSYPESMPATRRLLTTGNISKANTAARFLADESTFEFEHLQLKRN